MAEIQPGVELAAREHTEPSAPAGCSSRGAKAQTGFEGYYISAKNRLCFWLLVAVTCGLAYLAAHWSQRWWLRLHCASACPLRDATHVLITESTPGSSKRSHTVMSVKSAAGALGEATDTVRLVEHKGARFLLHPNAASFQELQEMPAGLTRELNEAVECLRSGTELREAAEGGRAARCVAYGPNAMLLAQKHPLRLFWDDMWHPYFVFQYFSVIVWTADGYVFYSMVILGITWMAICSQVYNTWAQSRRLAAMVKQTVVVRRLLPGDPREGGRASESIDAADLVPGDIIAIDADTQLPCDVVLLSGAAVLDEAMLTGESIPVRKSAWNGGNGSDYDPLKHSEFTLCGGTAVLQAWGAEAEAAPLAMVVRTSFRSAKGQLVRSMLHPEELASSFEGDTLVFLTFMSSLALAMYVVAVIIFVRWGAPASLIVARFLDMITVAVPPALPASMQVAVAISVWRLQRARINVIESRRIILAGALDCVAFDKTGTLTENALRLEELWLQASPGGALEEVKVSGQPTATASEEDEEEDGGSDEEEDCSEVVEHPFTAEEGADGRDSLWESVKKRDGESTRRAASGSVELTTQKASSLDVSVMSPHAVELLQQSGAVDEGAGLPAWEVLMATCHGLTVINGEVFGDPLDQSLWEHTRWSVLSDDNGNLAVHPPGKPASVYRVRKTWEFTSAEARSTVLVEYPDGRLKLFCKGSPERVAAIAGHSELPPQFAHRLACLMAAGLRCVALAEADVSNGDDDIPLSASREELEADLRLMGVVALNAPLKADSRRTITTLQHAGIRTCMLTGDHIATAVHTARQAHMLSSAKPVVCVEVAANETDATGEGQFLFKLIPPEESLAADDDHSATADKLGDETTGSIPALTINGDQHMSNQELLQLVLHDGAGLAATGAAVALAVQQAGQDGRWRGSSGGILEVMLGFGTVFGRMLPDAKAGLVDLLAAEDERASKRIPLRMGFVGDGANDIMALRAASVGLSLCEAEASVAAPLTSSRPSPRTIVEVIAEGRCSLACSYEVVQYIVTYAFIQVFGLNILYFFGLSVGNYQYLIQDMLFATTTSAFMGYTAPRKQLSRRPPPDRLLRCEVMGLLVAQIVLVVLFQIAALAVVSTDPSYRPAAVERGHILEISRSMETACISLMSLAQLVIAGVVNNRTTPFRLPIWHNPALLAVLAAQATFVAYLLLSPGGPGDWVTWTFAELVVMPVHLRAKLAGCMLANAGTALALDALLRRLVGCKPSDLRRAPRRRSKAATKYTKLHP